MKWWSLALTKKSKNLKKMKYKKHLNMYFLVITNIIFWCFYYFKKYISQLQKFITFLLINKIKKIQKFKKNYKLKKEKTYFHKINRTQVHKCMADSTQCDLQFDLGPTFLLKTYIDSSSNKMYSSPTNIIKTTWLICLQMMSMSTPTPNNKHQPTPQIKLVFLSRKGVQYLNIRKSDIPHLTLQSLVSDSFHHKLNVEKVKI